MTFDNPMQAFVEAERTATPAAKAKRIVKQITTPARETKKSCAIKIYEKNIKQGKSAVIALFKSDLAMTDAGANSYFYAVKKLAASK